MVSVIIPVYNCERYIEKAAQSVLQQSYRNIELIIVDDASTDSTPDLLKRMSGDPRLTVVTLARNSGTYVEINEGIRASRGAYITILGSDDTFMPDNVLLQVSALIQRSWCVVAQCKYTRVSESTGEILMSRFGESTILFRRQLLHEIGYFDSIRIGGDGEYIGRIRAAFGRKRIYRRKRVLYEALRRPNSLMRSSKTGSKSPVRLAYRKAYRAWHQSDGKKHMAYPLVERPFDAPREILP